MERRSKNPLRQRMNPMLILLIQIGWTRTVHRLQVKHLLENPLELLGKITSKSLPTNPKNSLLAGSIYLLSLSYISRSHIIISCKVLTKCFGSLYRYSELLDGGDSTDSDNEIEGTEDLDEKVAKEILLVL
jgi:hypothetical protein